MRFSNILAVVPFASMVCGAPEGLVAMFSRVDAAVSANMTVNATLALRGANATGVIDTSAIGFANVSGLVQRPRNNTAGMRVKDMYRDLAYSIKANEVRVRSRLDGHADYMFMASTNGGFPRVRAWFYNNGSNADSNFTTTYMIAFARVVEVNDTISWWNSTSYIDLVAPKGGISKWTKFLAGSFQINDTTVLTANSTFTDTTTGFNVNFATFVTQKSAPMPGADGALNPSAMKYSLGLSGYPFQFVNSHLVIVKAVWSSATSAQLSNANSSMLIDNSGSQINWNTTAGFAANSSSAYVSGMVQVDANITMPTVNDPIAVQPDSTTDTGSSEKPKLVAFHFLGNKTITTATNIWWDPEVAVAADATTSPSPSPTYSGTSGAAAPAMRSSLGLLVGMAGVAVAYLAFM